MSELNIEIIPPTEPFWNKGMKLTVVAIILAFLLLFTVISYVNYSRQKTDFKEVMYDYKKICGDVNFSGVSFSTYLTQDNNQVLCTFDNGLEPWIDYNGILKDNPDYHVCYKILTFKDKEHFIDEGVQCWGGRQ